jgi:DNA polymerase III alpha subunit
MIQLSVQTEYEFSRVFGPLPRVADRLQEVGASAAAITDSNTYGHVSFYEACKTRDIAAIFGVAKKVEGKLFNLYAANQDGLRELYRLNSDQELTLDKVRAASNNIVIGTISWFDPGISKASICLATPHSKWQRSEAMQFAKKNKLQLFACSRNAYPAAQDRRLAQIIGAPMHGQSAQHILSLAEMKHLMPDLPASAFKFAPIAERLGGVKPVWAQNLKYKVDLRKACEEGIKARGMQAQFKTKLYQERLSHELKTIEEKGFTDYFAVISDMVKYAKQHMLVGPARGSAAGSLVCYLLFITDIDPIPFHLLFERFIDETRFDFPDIDMDFPDTKRDLVIEYLNEKWGKENVARIGTVNKLKAKSAMNLVAKQYDIPPWDMVAFRESMVERSGGDARAQFCLLDSFELDAGKELLAKYPAAQDAVHIEGHASHSGVHAAGVIIGNEPISNYATINAEGIAQIDKYDAEKVNLMKIDCLGLRTLSVLEHTGIDVRSLPLDDKAALTILNDRKFAGVFQFEGIALQLLTRQIGVQSFEDIVTITSLARPGPLHAGAHILFSNRRFGKEPVAKVHPIFDKITEPTLGLVLYQEQVMQILRQVGMMEWADVQILRRAMSKSKGLEFFEQFYDRFYAGAIKNKMKPDAVRSMWELMIHFGSYGFNRSHAVAYALISYWCAYLKAHHPLKFALASLVHCADDDQARGILREIVREGMIQFVPFDPQHSELNWSIHDGKLLGGFINVKGIGKVKGAKYLADRNAGKKLPDFANVEYSIGELFEAQVKFRDYYEDPESVGLREGSRVTLNKDLSDQCSGEFVILGKLIEKNLRDLNETASLSKRGGQRISGDTTFLHLKLEDDTDLMMATVGRFDMRTLGKQFLDAPLNSWWLIRGEMKKGWRRIYVKKAKRLE